MACSIGAAGSCKPYGRLHVRIRQDNANDGEKERHPEDELGSFIFRTTGFNSIRTLATRLRYFQAVSGDRLDCMDLELRLRGKSTTQSHRTPIYYVDITTKTGSSLEAAVNDARQRREQQIQAGIDQSLLDEAARCGYALGEFEESEEETVGVVEEFFSEAGQDGPQEDGQERKNLPPSTAPLAVKLQRKASASSPAAAAA